MENTTKGDGIGSYGRGMRFVLASGRRVAVTVTSTRALGTAPEDVLVVVCGPAPGAGVLDPDPNETRARRVTLLSVDRPGYGRSDPVARGCWATVASAADDVAAVLESMSAERVSVVGWSAGGRVALALAARHPQLVERVALVATPAPDAEVPWVDETQRAILDDLRALSADAAHAELDRRLGSFDPDDPFWGDAFWPVAAASEQPALADLVRAAFAHGTAGLAADIAGWSLRPWGFEPEDVAAKTLLLYGGLDPVATPKHGRWWQKRLPDARLEVWPGEGHLLVFPAWARILSHLAPGSGRVRALPRPRRWSEPALEEHPAA